jgi:hypothetical protein
MVFNQDIRQNQKQKKEELRALLRLITENGIDRLTEKERGFYNEMRTLSQVRYWTPSGKQILYLRDLKDKYL